MIAAELAPGLLAAGARAVIATGSAGRGDAEPGSDLDLWVIDDREGVSYARVGRIPVTLFRCSEARMLSPAHLATIEVDGAFVIADPDEVLKRVFMLYEQHAEGIRANHIAAAEACVRQGLARAKSGPPQGRLLRLREVARVAATVRLLIDAGVMVPKIRHFRAYLAPEAVAAFTEIQGYDAVIRDLDAIRVTSAGIVAQVAAKPVFLIRPPDPLGPPASALLKLDEGHLEDGVELLRRGFDQILLDPQLRVFPQLNPVQFFLDHEVPEFRSYWEAIHGLRGSVEQIEAAVEHAGALLARLLELVDMCGA